MSLFQVSPGKLKDTRKLADRLRAADVREIEVLTGLTPREALILPFRRPAGKTRIYTILDGGSVAGMFGVSSASATPVGSRVGYPWFLCSEQLIQRHLRRLVARTDGWLELLGQHYDVLENYIHDRNETHIRWLKRKNFHFVQHYQDFRGTGEGVWRFRRSCQGADRPFE